MPSATEGPRSRHIGSAPYSARTGSPSTSAIDAGVLDDAADLGETGQRALGGEHERAGVAVPGRAVELLLLAEVALLDGDERLLGRRVVGGGLRFVAGVGDEHTGRPGGGGDDGRSAGEGPPAHQPSSPSSPPTSVDGPSPDSPDGAAAIIGPPSPRPHSSAAALNSSRRAPSRRRRAAVPAGVHAAVVAEHRVGHVDAVLADALGELEHVGLHLGLAARGRRRGRRGRSPSTARRPPGRSGTSRRPSRPRRAIATPPPSPLICGSGMSMPWSRMHSVNASIASSMSSGAAVPSVVVSGVVGTSRRRGWRRRRRRRRRRRSTRTLRWRAGRRRRRRPDPVVWGFSLLSWLRTVADRR